MSAIARSGVSARIQPEPSSCPPSPPAIVKTQYRMQQRSPAAVSERLTRRRGAAEGAPCRSAARLGIGAGGGAARLLEHAECPGTGARLVVDTGGAGPGHGPRLAERLSMQPDEWQAFVTRQSAQEIARWLEGRGGLHRPIASLSMHELEAMATAAISRFVVLASERRQQAPEESDELTRLLLA